MNVQGRFLAALNSPSGEVFLVALGHRLGISAREVFVADAPEGQRRARACNEMMIAIWSQVWAAKDEEAHGYPDAEFLSVLLDKADAGDARGHLRNAIESALAAI